MDIILVSEISNYHAIDSVRIDQLQQQIGSLQNFIDISNGIISNEISSSNNYLSVVSICIGVISLILTLVGFGIGYYINSLYKKIHIIEKTISEKERKIVELSKTVHDTNEKITNDLGSIYKKLRKEELKALIKRLELEPLDIKHCISMLLSNELEDSWFDDLCHAYKKLIESGKADSGTSLFDSSYGSNYKIVFFQHYLYKCLLSKDMRDDIVAFFEEGCGCAYERDIIKCTKDLCNALNESVMPKPTDALYNYLVAVNQSSYKSLSSIKEIIDSELIDKSLLRQAIDRCTNNKIFLELYRNAEPIDDEQ